MVNPSSRICNSRWGARRAAPPLTPGQRPTPPWSRPSFCPTYKPTCLCTFILGQRPQRAAVSPWSAPHPSPLTHLFIRLMVYGARPPAGPAGTKAADLLRALLPALAIAADSETPFQAPGGNLAALGSLPWPRLQQSPCPKQSVYIYFAFKKNWAQPFLSECRRVVERARLAD